MEIIDLRPSILYDEEHIPDARHKTIADLADYTPRDNAEIIIITLADDTVSVEQADAVFRAKSFPYAFLENGMAGWKAQNGNTVSVGNPDSVTDRAKVSFKTAPETKALLESPEKNFYTIIDTRSAGLYRSGHIPGAMNIPVEDLEQRRADIPRSQHIIVYGKSDLESFQAAVRLYDLNIFSPYALENGFAAWTEKKYTIEK
jgi:rhodanese-related sulfurtransferase